MSTPIVRISCVTGCESHPKVLDDILGRLEEGGIAEIHVGFDESAWHTGWAGDILTAFEANMAARESASRSSDTMPGWTYPFPDRGKRGAGQAQTGHVRTDGFRYPSLR